MFHKWGHIVCAGVCPQEQGGGGAFGNFFCAQLPAVTQYVLDVPDKENGLIFDSKMLSKKGLFCFDLPDAHDAIYKRVCSPLIPLCLDSLPVDFMKIMQCHRLEVDFRTAQTVQVKKGC